MQGDRRSRDVIHSHTHTCHATKVPTSRRAQLTRLCGSRRDVLGSRSQSQDPLRQHGEIDTSKFELTGTSSAAEIANTQKELGDPSDQHTIKYSAVGVIISMNTT